MPVEAQNLTWEPASGPIGGNIQFIKQLADGAIWAGTNGHGLFRRLPLDDQWKPSGLNGHKVNVMEVGGTVLYVGTQSGGAFDRRYW